MGSGAYWTTTSFCFSCFRFTDHRVYTDRRDKTDQVSYYDYDERKYKYDHSIFYTYITTTEVCTRCGKSSSNTETYKSEGCFVF